MYIPKRNGQMMKKIFALLITFIYLTANASFAFSDLYCLHNVSEQKINSIVKNNLLNQNFSLKSENPIYAVYDKNPNRNAVVIIQQNGADVFYYFNSKDKELNQGFLRTFRSFRIGYEQQAYNTNILRVYDNIAEKTMNSSGKANQYTFDDDDEPVISSANQIPQNQPIQNQNTYNYLNQNTYNSVNQNTYSPKPPLQYVNNNQYNNGQNVSTVYANSNTVTLPAYPPQNKVVTLPAYPANTQNTYNTYNTQSTYTPVRTHTAQQATVLKGSIVSIDSGTKFKTYLQNPINTSSANKGDRVVAVLTDDIKSKGVNVVPQGSIVYGTLSKARHATYGSRNGRVVIEFNQLVTPDNKTYEISTEKIDFTVTNDGKIARTVGNAVAGAAVGALAGLLFAALGDYSFGTAAAIGAGIGAGSSLIGSGAERGVDAEIPSFTELELTLTKPFKVSVNQ